MGVLLVFMVFIFLWMIIFGNIVIYMVFNEGLVELFEVVFVDIFVVLFKFFEYLLFIVIVLILVMVFIVIFFVIFFDFGLLVVDMLMFGGENEDMSVW